MLPHRLCGTSIAPQMGPMCMRCGAFSRHRIVPIPGAMYLGVEECPLSNQSHKLCRVMETPGAVNQHFLDHVVACSTSSEIEASEDILASNGMKLLAKGAKVDARVRERLLEYKLKKPLEASLRVVDGVGSRRIDRVAEQLMEQHPLLSRVCGLASGKLLTTALRNLTLSTEVDSILSIYAARGESKLNHAVGTSLLSAALARELSNPLDAATLLLAGLVHDVGELYIDPKYLQAGARLSLDEWKHIATHPIVGSHVLSTMPGAGQVVARAVLHHHERQDGFGYPAGLRGEAVSIAGQVLAVAELLMGLMETGTHHAQRANVALKLIPGEFNRTLLDRVVTASRAVEPEGMAPALPDDIAMMARHVGALRARLSNLDDLKALLSDERRNMSAALGDLVALAVERCERIRVALSSTGLDALSPTVLTEELLSMAPAARLEMGIVVRELRWRMAELERQATIRAERLGSAEAAKMGAYVNLAKAKGQPVPA
jgi:hypothetical protein